MIITKREDHINGAVWLAYRDEWDIGSPIGYGESEREAINDLLDEEEKYGL